MLEKKFQRISDFLLAFALFLLANASVFLFIFWLSTSYLLFALVLWFLLALITVWKLRNHGLFPDFFETLQRNWIIYPFVVFSGASIFWSVFWEVSLLRWLTLLFTILAGGYIGIRFGPKKILEPLSIFGIVLLLVAALLVVFVPRLGVQNYYIIQGAWKGLYWHKNHMGLIAAFFNILFLLNAIYAWQSKEKPRRILLWGLLYLFTLVFVYQTDSAGAYLTSLVVHGVILLALAWLRFGSYIRRSHILIFSALLIVAAILILSNLDFVFGLFGRNPSLTGRVPMWTYLFDTYISKRPLAGYGFNAFWYIDAHKVDIQHAAGYPDPIIIADNGFIDILANTGLIGLGLFFVFYLGVWWRSIRYSFEAKDIIGFFPVILMTYTLLANVSWSLIFEDEAFFMLLMVAVLFALSRQPQ